MNRFIRLDSMFHISEWLIVLSSEARLCWVLLLCYVKNAGRNGRVRAMSPAIASRLWWVGEESVRQLLTAAQNHGALLLDGEDWIVAKWSNYQGDPTNSERQSRFRETRSNADNALRNGRNTEKEREIDRETETREPPLFPPKGDADVPAGIAGCWKEWIDYRRERKLPVYKAKTIARLVKWLLEQPDPSAVVEQSIRNSWQGLFELKSGPKPTSRTAAQLTREERRRLTS